MSGFESQVEKGAFEFMAWWKGGFLLPLALRSSCLYAPLCPFSLLPLHDMLCVHAVTWGEESLKLLGPTKILYWQIVIQMVLWRNEVFIILLLLSLSFCFSLFPAHDFFWDLLDFNNFNEWVRTSKILLFCKYWIWAGDCETIQQEIQFSMRQQRIWQLEDWWREVYYYYLNN